MLRRHITRKSPAPRSCLCAHSVVIHPHVFCKLLLLQMHTRVLPHTHSDSRDPLVPNTYKGVTPVTPLYLICTRGVKSRSNVPFLRYMYQSIARGGGALHVCEPHQVWPLRSQLRVTREVLNMSITSVEKH